jgi:hypothetical protein
VTLTVDDLRTAGLGAQCESIEQAIADHQDGTSANVAVVSEPFAGRDILLTYAEELLGDAVERLRFAPTAAVGERPQIPDAPAIILDDCQYLFRRQIGGFDALDRLLEEIAVSDTLFLTSWNRYAWAYLASVRDVADSFPVEIRIPPLTAAQIEALLRENYGPEMPTFVDTGEAGRIKTIAVERVSVGLPGGRSATIPIPTPNPEWVTSWFQRDADEGIEAVVYEKLRRLSHGNPGLVTTFWEAAVRDGTIAPAYVEDPISAPQLDDESALLALLLVTFERLPWDVLSEMMPGDGVETSLQRLETQGIVDVDDGEVSLEPAGVHGTVEHLRGRRLLW